MTYTPLPEIRVSQDFDDPTKFNLTVWTHWTPSSFASSPLDRPVTYGLNFGSVDTARAWNLARRYSLCMLAGKAFDTSAVKVDVDGASYVQANSTIYGKRASADLKRLGF